MRCQQRNKRGYWYANQTGTARSGLEWVITYTDPIYAEGNISSSKGEAQATVFGVNLSYDRVICSESTEMNEQSILWIDTAPKLEADGSTKTPNDYIVKRVASGLDNVLVAVQRVEVNV